MFFLSLLIKVVDLHEVPPESALEFCKLLPDHRTRILVCGGDGSVGWVLAALDKVKLKVCKDQLIAFAWLLFTEADKGQSKNIYEIRKNVFKIRKKYFKS